MAARRRNPGTSPGDAPSRVVRRGAGGSQGLRTLLLSASAAALDRASVQLQFVPDASSCWTIPHSFGALRILPLRFSPRRANEPIALMRNHRETHAPDARRRTHSKLEPGVCLKIGEECTSSAFCLIGKRMTSSVPSLGVISFQILFSRRRRLYSLVTCLEPEGAKRQQVYAAC